MWVEGQIGDFADIRHGFAFKGEFFANDGQFIVLTPGNCHETGGFRSKSGREKFYSAEPPDGYLLRRGDVLVVMTDLVNTAPVLGGSFRIPEDHRYLHNQRLGLVQITRPDLMDERFLYHLLNTHHYRAQVRGSASGATVRHTSPGRIKSCKVRYPSTVSEQVRIADVLSAYDDAIENNRKRIALLEEATRLLYGEWFVYLRFPGHQHVKVVDRVPDGWERVSASEAFQVNPTTPRGERDGITYVPMAALSEAGMLIDKRPFERRRESTSVRFRNGDTLFARITPCLENGKTGFVQFLGPDEVACGSTEFIILRGRRVSNYFVYLTARQPDFRENAIRSMTGSSGRQRVQPSCFDRYSVRVPPQYLASAFDEHVAPIFRQVRVLDQQNQGLAEARDLLLPRLMNGELAV